MPVRDDVRRTPAPDHATVPPSSGWTSGPWFGVLAVVLSAATTVAACLTLQSDWTTGALVVVAALSAVLAALLATGLRTGGALGALLAAQAVYWIISFVVRPLVLLGVQPRVRTDDGIADPRLAHLGYAGNVAQVLGIVLGGLLVYVLSIVVATRFVQRWTVQALVARSDALALLAVGWVLRLAALALPSSAVANTLAGLGTVGVGCTVLLSGRRTPPALLALLAASELLWSALAEIKTPVLALVLWLVINQFTGGRKVSRRLVLALGVAAYLAFSVIQSVKVAAGLVSGTNSTEQYYPWFVRPLLPLITRFDLLSAATDASFAGPRSWMTPGEALTRFLLSFIPQQVLPGEKAGNLGLLWTREIRSLSLPSQVDTVFLAQGPTAEGWVVAGWPGVVVECVLVALALLLVARCLTSARVAAAVFGITMTSQPYLFERGVLAIGEGAGKAVQVTVVSLVVLATARLVRRGRATGPEPVHAGGAAR